MKLHGIFFCIFLLVLFRPAVKTAGNPGAGKAGGEGEAALRAASQVSRDSLEAMVRFLSMDPATSKSRSRFTLRETELAGIADSLSARLERYTGAPVQRMQFRVKHSHYSPDSFTTENIVARLEGTGGDESVFLVTAHYDATGTRTGGWDEHWETMPAPGADDNATGVAALLEAARVLAGYELPFDVQFVLFSGEELGKFGSIDFAERCDSVCAGRILGVLNVDMIGFNEEGEPGGNILTDQPSAWISDIIVEALAGMDPELPIGVMKLELANWDHASFWENESNGEPHHIPAVTMTEILRSGGFIIYPYYHTVKDSILYVDFEQAERITRLLVGFLAGFSEDVQAEIALLPSDIVFNYEGSFTGTRNFQVGNELGIYVRVRNTAGAAAPEGSGLRLNIVLENSTDCRTVFTGELDPPGPLEAHEIEIFRVLDESFIGENRVRAEITVSGFEEFVGNNILEERFIVAGGGEIMAGHNFRPNPIKSSFSEALFCVNLAVEANLLLELYTLEGERISTAYLGTGYGVPLGAGFNCLECGTIFPGVDDLASGIYLYRIKLYELDGKTSNHTGRFAVEN